MFCVGNVLDVTLSLTIESISSIVPSMPEILLYFVVEVYLGSSCSNSQMRRLIEKSQKFQDTHHSKNKSLGMSERFSGMILTTLASYFQDLGAINWQD